MTDYDERLKLFARELFGRTTDPIDYLVANQADAEYEAGTKAAHTAQSAPTTSTIESLAEYLAPFVYGRNQK